MKNITRALNNIADALNNIASAITSKDKYKLTPISSTKPTTSNPVSINYTQFASYTKDQNEVVANIVKILNEKGSYPEHHESVMRDLSVKWPNLYLALQDLITAYNQNHRISSTKIERLKDR